MQATTVAHCLACGARGGRGGCQASSGATSGPDGGARKWSRLVARENGTDSGCQNFSAKMLVRMWPRAPGPLLSTRGGDSCPRPRVLHFRLLPRVRLSARAIGEVWVGQAMDFCSGKVRCFVLAWPWLCCVRPGLPGPGWLDAVVLHWPFSCSRADARLQIVVAIRVSRLWAGSF